MYVRLCVWFVCSIGVAKLAAFKPHFVIESVLIWMVHLLLYVVARNKFDIYIYLQLLCSVRFSKLKTVVPHFFINPVLISMVGLSTDVVA